MSSYQVTLCIHLSDEVRQWLLVIVFFDWTAVHSLSPLLIISFSLALLDRRERHVLRMSAFYWIILGLPLIFTLYQSESQIDFVDVYGKRREMNSSLSLSPIVFFCFRMASEREKGASSLMLDRWRRGRRRQGDAIVFQSIPVSNCRNDILRKRGSRIRQRTILSRFGFQLKSSMLLSVVRLRQDSRINLIKLQICKAQIVSVKLWNSRTLTGCRIRWDSRLELRLLMPTSLIW